MRFIFLSLPLTAVIFSFSVVASSSVAITIISSLAPMWTPSFAPLASLLPHPFGPYDLLYKGAPRLLESHYNELGVVEAAKDNGTAGERGWSGD
ncbi:hypothetical protein Cni_G04125 [Canna indica]|uniref:Uncharacterized protein n=1 Tax=Canna indica TaxID=4628 RepID=A0AAQ3JSA0_9LILI|nr:hypothetical protein Cni_G04125 [Canna indica]